LKKLISKLEILKSKEYKQLVENFFSLSILNGLSFFLPLLSLPYLIRVIGVEKYGAVSFSLVIIQYINLLSTYGFSFSATKQISINRENNNKVSEIFSSVITLRVIITTICLIILSGIIFFIPKLYKEHLLYLYSLGIVIGDIFIPLWLFQGMEKMRYVSIVNILSKVIFTILIFVIIHEKQDYIYVPLLTSVGTICSSVLSMYLSKKMFNIHFIFPKMKIIREQFQEGWHLFVSIIGMNFYRNANPLILGMLTSDLSVGYYVAAEKIIKAFQSVISPMTDSLYPFFSRKFSAKSDIDNINVLFRIAKYYVIILLFLTTIILGLSGNVILVYLGKSLLPSVLNLQIMSFVVLFGGLNYFFGIIGLINMGHEKRFTVSILISGLLSLMVCVTLSPIIYDKAASIAMLTSEVCLFILIFSAILKIKKTNKVESEC